MVEIALTAAVLFWIVSIADVIGVDGDDMVRMSKEQWLAFVVFAPVVGGLVWLRRGRATHLPFPATLPAHGIPKHL